MRKQDRLSFAVLVGLIIAACCAATPPTSILSTDLLVNSRSTINNNFSDLYAQRASLVDCTGVTGRFVQKLNASATASICGTLTWNDVTLLSGYPGVVFTWNGRAGAVTMTAADVAGVEQDLRVSASPTFAGMTLNGGLAVTTGGITSVNGIGYAFSATSQVNGGGVDIACSGSCSLFTGSTTAATMFHLTDSGGSCTLSSTNGMVCTGTQGVKASDAPTFDGLTLTAALSATSASFTGDVVVSPTITALPYSTASLLCSGAGSKGKMVTVTDSNTNTWGAAIAGSGSNVVLAFCNGSALTVAGK